MTQLFNNQQAPLSSAYDVPQVMIDIWLDYRNNYLTVSGYAERNALTMPQAARVLGLAQAIFNSTHPEA
jgi:hypothetical protein